MTNADDADRLAKILGLLGSSHDGEILAAARQAERLRSSLGLMWHDIIGGTAPKSEYRQQNTPSWQNDAKFCRERSDYLNDWEQGFITSITLRWTPTEKQQRVLDRLVAKCRAYESSNT